MTNVPPFPKTSEDRVYLSHNDSSSWFTREEIPHSAPIGRSVFVARTNALSNDITISPDQIVWTPGTTTWFALAERGVWVHGCNDGLGEEETPSPRFLEELIGDSVPPFVRLSHEDSGSDGIELWPTYRLRPSSNSPDLRGKTHFFWTSGSAFMRALELFPHIRNGWHGCGPGKTYRAIRSVIHDSSKVRVFLSEKSWKTAVCY